MTTSQSNITELSLQDVHDRVVLEYLPLICGFSIIGILGIFGNAFTIVFFTKRLQSSTTFLLVSLAWFDLFVCITSFGTVADMSMNVFHSSVYSCKCIYVLVTWTTYASALTVWVISIDRYRKICNPLKTQLSFKGAKVAVVIIVIVTAVLSARILATQAVSHISIQAETNGSRNLTVFMCHEPVSGDLNTLILSFHVLEALCATGTCITIVVTYGMVVKALYLHDKSFRTFGRQRGSLSKIQGQSQSHSDTWDSELQTDPGSSDVGGSYEADTITTISKGNLNLNTVTKEGKPTTSFTTFTEHPKDIDEHDFSLAHISLQNMESVNSNEVVSTDNTGQSNIPTPHDTCSTAECANIARTTDDRRTTYAKRDDELIKRNRGIRKSERKATIMMLTVSVAFLLCYVPYICMRLVQKRWNINTVEDFRAQTWIPFLLPTINSVVNPVLYFILNRTYRQYLKRLFDNCRLAFLVKSFC